MTSRKLLRSALIVAGAAAVLGFAVPAGASQLPIFAPSEGGFTAMAADGYSETYDNDRGVRVCDTSFDGWDVYSNFYVNNDSSQKRVSTSEGAGSCAKSGTYSAGIDRHNTCLNRPALPDTCTSYRYV